MGIYLHMKKCVLENIIDTLHTYLVISYFTVFKLFIVELF